MEGAVRHKCRHALMVRKVCHGRYDAHAHGKNNVARAYGDTANGVHSAAWAYGARPHLTNSVELVHSVRAFQVQRDMGERCACSCHEQFGMVVWRMRSYQAKRAIRAWRADM